jgi:GNAT superfamily N-acetyltransferase
VASSTILPVSASRTRQTIDPVSLAYRLENVEARNAIVSGIARRSFQRDIWLHWEWFGSACAIFAGYWTHLTQAIITSDDTTAADVRNVDDFLLGCRAIPTIHVCELFDTTAIREHGFEHIGGTDVVWISRTEPVRRGSSPVAHVRPDDVHGRDEWATISSAGCLGRELLRPEELEIGAIGAHMSETELFTVSARDNPAACGALYTHDGVGLLLCDSTLPEYRGNGFQRDLIGARVQAAWDAGCEFAMASVQPGSASAKNYMRCGFQRAYSRLTFQRPHG